MRLRGTLLLPIAQVKWMMVLKVRNIQLTPLFQWALHLFYIFTAGDRDFERRSGSIKFVPGGPKQRSIEIPITDDQEMENDEPLVISFSSTDIPPDVMLNIPSSVITIIDNDMSECQHYCLVG